MGVDVSYDTPHSYHCFASLDIRLPPSAITLPTSAEPLTRDKAGRDTDAKPTVWQLSPSGPDHSNRVKGEVAINIVTTETKRGNRQAALDGPTECLTYHDPFSYVYKK
jgi:nitrite reductase (NAD(P)H)